MLLTDAQKIIIREICSIQFKSLEDILIQVDLGSDVDGDRYEDILMELGLDRKDFDIELIKTIKKFREIEKEPERLFTFDELDMIIFRYILFNFAHKWQDRYPKAYYNLWNKLYIWDFSNELYNKQ